MAPLGHSSVLHLISILMREKEDSHTYLCCEQFHPSLKVK